MKRELRTFKGLQLRAKADDKFGVTGYAAVFNEVADLGFFREVIKPGAFSRAIAEKQDVRCLQNHDSNLVLGRTTNSTLSLSEDDLGLRFECDFPPTQAAKDLYELLKRGDINQCSFGFSVTKQTWTEEEDDDGDWLITREIEDVDLFDVSPVTFPAYEGTTCEARQLFPDGAPENLPKEVRARLKGKRDAEACQCECPECQAGNCIECSDPECDDPNCPHEDAAKGTKARSAALSEIAAEIVGAAEPSQESIDAQLAADRVALESDTDRLRYTQTAALSATL